MSELTTALGIALPVIAAPMAGGPGSPALVEAAGRAGSLGFLAAGYKTPDDLAAQITAMTGPFGVNLFVPNPLPVDPAAYRRYAEVIAAEADRYGVEVDATAPPIEDDDGWAAKLEVLRAQPVAVVSLTFGLPRRSDLALLRRTGAYLVQTVTNVEEARAAAEAGVDALAVQAAAAGGHSGTFTPARYPADIPLGRLVASVRHAVDLPLIAAGGIASPDAVTAALRSGADAVAVGTVLLRAPEAGTSATHKAALTHPHNAGTVLTHAFTGRPARALRNAFIDAYADLAPLGYPAVHHLTSPMRKAAAAAGDAQRVHLWAGTGFRSATEEPVAVILARLADS